MAEDQYLLVWTEDYRNHLRTVLGNTQLCNKFLKVVLPGNQEVSISRRQLKEEMKLSEEEITYVRREECNYCRVLSLPPHDLQTHSRGHESPIYDL